MKWVGTIPNASIKSRLFFGHLPKQFIIGVELRIYHKLWDPLKRICLDNTDRRRLHLNDIGADL